MTLSCDGRRSKYPGLSQIELKIGFVGVFWSCKISTSVPHFRPTTVLYISINIRANSLQNLHEGLKAVPRDQKIGPDPLFGTLLACNRPIARFCTWFLNRFLFIPPTCRLHFVQSLSPSLLPPLPLSPPLSPPLPLFPHLRSSLPSLPSRCTSWSLPPQPFAAHRGYVRSTKCPRMEHPEAERPRRTEGLRSGGTRLRGDTVRTTRRRLATRGLRPLSPRSPTIAKNGIG